MIVVAIVGILGYRHSGTGYTVARSHGRSVAGQPAKIAVEDTGQRCVLLSLDKVYVERNLDRCLSWNRRDTGLVTVTYTAASARFDHLCHLTVGQPSCCARRQVKHGLRYVPQSCELIFASLKDLAASRPDLFEIDRRPCKHRDPGKPVGASTRIRSHAGSWWVCAGLVPSFVWTVHFFPLTSSTANWFPQPVWICAAVLRIIASCGRIVQACTLLLALPRSVRQYQLGMIATASGDAIRAVSCSMLAAYALGPRLSRSPDREATIFYHGGSRPVSALVSASGVRCRNSPFWRLLFSTIPTFARPFGNLGRQHVTTTGMGDAFALYLGNRLRVTGLLPIRAGLSSGLHYPLSNGAIFLALSIVALFAPTALRSERVLWRWVAAEHC